MPTAIEELAPWLREQIGADERIAKATKDCRCGRCDYGLSWKVEGDWVTELGIGIGHTEAPGYLNEEQVAHITRHDPATELVDIDAKMLMVSRCEAALVADDVMAAALALFVLWCMAARYASRPGFREEWRV